MESNFIFYIYIPTGLNRSVLSLLIGVVQGSTSLNQTSKHFCSFTCCNGMLLNLIHTEPPFVFFIGLNIILFHSCRIELHHIPGQQFL